MFWHFGDKWAYFKLQLLGICSHSRLHGAIATDQFIVTFRNVVFYQYNAIHYSLEVSQHLNLRNFGQFVISTWKISTKFSILSDPPPWSNLWPNSQTAYEVPWKTSTILVAAHLLSRTSWRVLTSHQLSLLTMVMRCVDLYADLNNHSSLLVIALIRRMGRYCFTGVCSLTGVGATPGPIPGHVQSPVPGSIWGTPFLSLVLSLVL